MVDLEMAKSIRQMLRNNLSMDDAVLFIKVTSDYQNDIRGGQISMTQYEDLLAMIEEHLGEAFIAYKNEN